MTGSPASRTIVDKCDEQVEIVPYRPNHFEGLVDMYRDYPSEQRSHGLPPVLEDDLVEWVTSLDEEGRSFVALLDDRIVGHAAYTPLSSDTPDFVVFVDPAYQNRGIGTALLDHVVRNIAAEGFDGIVSYVDRDNESAIHVYEKIGFEDVKRDPLIVKMRIDFSDSEWATDDDVDRNDG